MKYSYSTDGGELYHGEFDSEHDAAMEAFSADPDLDSVYIGEVVNPSVMDFVCADWIFEDIGERAYDQCGEVSEDWLRSLMRDKEKKSELERIIADFIEKHEPPTFWAIENPKSVDRVDVIYKDQQ